jgi:hypothetical protein
MGAGLPSWRRVATRAGDHRLAGEPKVRSSCSMSGSRRSSVWLVSSPTRALSSRQIAARLEVAGRRSSVQVGRILPERREAMRDIVFRSEGRGSNRTESTPRTLGEAREDSAKPEANQTYDLLKVPVEPRIVVAFRTVTLGKRTPDRNYGRGPRRRPPRQYPRWLPLGQSSHWRPCLDPLAPRPGAIRSGSG